MKFTTQNLSFVKCWLFVAILFFASCLDNKEDILTNRFWVETYYSHNYHSEQKFAIFFGSNHKYCGFYNYEGKWEPYIIGLSDTDSPERIEDCIGEWSIANDSFLILSGSSYKILNVNMDSLFLKNNFLENKDTVKYYRSDESPIVHLPN